MIIRTKSYPRAALIGNPSDGYFGKTIAFVFSNFSAQVTLYESPRLEIVPGILDKTEFESLDHLVSNVNKFGYYGGKRLIKGALKKFHDYCRLNSIDLAKKNFTIEYSSTIPHSLGLAGSSAIITACMKALMQFYEIDIPKPILANSILKVETEELGIPAGLQDRVAQVYEQPVFMDFNKETMDKQGYGNYEVLKPELFPPMYIAYRTSLSEGSEVLHTNLRERYNLGVPEVLQAVQDWANLTVQVKELLLSGKGREMAPLINKNFDIRRAVCELSKGNIEMVETARSAGASAKFTGSGGAIIGTYTNDEMFDVLKVKLNARNIEVLKPIIINNE